MVPAGMDERRFAVLDVGEAHMQDHKYFAAIDDEMDNGGREALLYYLQHFDLSKVDLRVIPKTRALLEQKIATSNPEAKWWFDVLARGELPGGTDVPNQCPVNLLCDHYIQHASKRGIPRKSSETQLGIFLHKHVPELIKTRAGYIFPPLVECRKAFAKRLGHGISWAEAGQGWSIEPQPIAISMRR
jgi:hypothetical protein